jgi:acrosin
VIEWSATSSSTGGVTYLDIKGPAAGSTYNINDTSNFYYYTFLSTGAGSDTVNVNGTTGFIYVYNGGGQDYVYVGKGTLAGVNGSVDVYGAGSTYLYVYDYSDLNSHTATLTNGSLSGLSTGTIYYSPTSASTGGVTFLDIFGSSAGSTYKVNSTATLYYWTDLNTGGGSDTVNVNGTTGFIYVYNSGGQDYVYVGNGTLASINGSVDVYGPGSTYLYVYDYNDLTSRTATLTGSSLTGMSTGTILWTPTSSSTGGVTFLDIFGSSAGSTYNVTTTPGFYYWTDLNTGVGNDVTNIKATGSGIYVNNGGGADKVVVGSQAPLTAGGNVAGIGGFVDAYGAGTIALTVDDSGDSTGRSATLTSSSLSGLAPATIYYGSNVTSFTINGGTGNDSLTVSNMSTTTLVTWAAGGGTNTLVGPNATNAWSITTPNAGKLNTNLTFKSVANLVGGTGVDVFKFSGTGKISGAINGGGAPAGQGDWLDYSSVTYAVTVNLATGAASSTGGVSNIQNVHGGNHGNTLTGSSQGNILIGGLGAGTITGGSGRSILIADKGSAHIFGGSGGDILIGDFTTFDTMTTTHELALMSILDEWQSSDSYATRFHDINTGTGGGLNGKNKLNWGTTVKDGAAPDAALKLTAAASSQALDWFFLDSNDTKVNYETGEHVNNT